MAAAGTPCCGTVLVSPFSISPGYISITVSVHTPVIKIIHLIRLPTSLYAGRWHRANHQTTTRLEHKTGTLTHPTLSRASIGTIHTTICLAIYLYLRPQDDLLLYLASLHSSHDPYLRSLCSRVGIGWLAAATLPDLTIQVDNQIISHSHGRFPG
jgi:hypothetical protein